MKITLLYRGPATDEGAHYSFSHDSEVRDAQEAVVIGREFATLTYYLSAGMIEGQKVALQVEE